MRLEGGVVGDLARPAEAKTDYVGTTLPVRIVMNRKKRDLVVCPAVPD